MAVLQTLRTKFGLAISIIVALGLLSFIIDPGQIQSAVQSMSSKYDVGKINGKSISYTDFQEEVDRFTNLNELMTGTSASSEEDQIQVRNAAWQSLVDKFLFPPLVTITDDARRRLKAIEEFSDLGSGFNIAMQDLDIRGAGNLLGAEQSGFIMDMGYETYQKILAEAMEELGVETGLTAKNMRNAFVEDCTIETDQPALIPDDFIDINAEKIRIYKQLDSMVSEKEIDRFAAQLADRFGKLPTEVENLLYVVKVRNLGASLGFDKIIVKNGMMICFFISNPMSSYYRSPVFNRVLERIGENPVFNLKQVENKLKIVQRNVDSMMKAHSLLSKLQ